ncbi:hypothetical protein [Legionella tucsonensis]|uniref:Uncharacterized protein n=1 Tax=Legionella tucsonensis TaxID=40335 RepID=A0A0W0ZQD7_9GAMM|nr:hypothetical protein [Legionella tucsonensis]KTD71250.1 hypothetical protein Ltuc_2609 [Legionella tucsonensis]
MQTKYESTSMEAKNKEKKNVSWNDGKTEGQMEKNSLTAGTAASLRKEKLDAKVEKLVSKGYTEIEAAALAGRPMARGIPEPICIITDPIYYASKEEIEQQKLLREQSSSKSGKNEANRYSFFSPTNIVLGVAMTAAAVGIIALNK